MKVSFGGIGESIATFYNDGTYPAAAGDPVKMTDSAQVGEAGDGERFVGVAASADSDYAAVQLGGYITMGYTGTAPSTGLAHLVSDGAGKVKVDAGTTSTLTDNSSESVTHVAYTGGEFLVIDVDTTAGTVGFIL